MKNYCKTLSRVFNEINEGLTGKISRISRVIAMLLNYICVNAIFLGPTVLEIFYFKHVVVVLYRRVPRL